MAFHTVLFDLDGTLTDSGEGIVRAASYALRQMGQPVLSEDFLRSRFIGPPLRDSFMTFCHMSEAEAETAIEAYRVYYAERGWKENYVYDGMDALVADLHAAGKKVVVATSKPEHFAVQILAYFGLADHFTAICGAPMRASAGHGKTDVIRDAFRRADIQGTTGVVMVGDRHYDVDSAHEVGIPAVGVLFGYGTREELTACGADFLAEDVSALRSLLMS